MNPGNYQATVVKTRFGLTKNQNLQIGIQFSVEEGGVTEEIWGNVYLSEKAMGMARARLKACGFDCDSQSLCDLEEQPDMLAGNRTEIEVAIEEYNGNAQLKVVNIGKGYESPGPDKLRKYDAALRAAKNRKEEEGGLDLDKIGPPPVSAPKTQRAAAPAKKSAAPY